MSASAWSPAVRRCARSHSTQTIAPVANASRMKSDSNMNVGGVVPDARELFRRPVEDDAPAHEDDALHEALDGSELVGDVENRDVKLSVEVVEQDGKRLLGSHVHSRSGLVE